MSKSERKPRRKSAAKEAYLVLQKKARTDMTARPSRRRRGTDGLYIEVVIARSSAKLAKIDEIAKKTTQNRLSVCQRRRSALPKP